MAAHLIRVPIYKMRNQPREIDIVDVHVTSQDDRVDAFSQYPLLDGDKRYTVELTEFVCPLAGQGALPSVSWFSGVYGDMLRLRRKRTNGAAYGHVDTILPAANAGVLFTDVDTIFRKDSRRPMATPGDLAYQLQRYFDDIQAKFISSAPAALILARNALADQQDIVADDNSTAAQIAAAQALIDGPNGLQAAYDAVKKFEDALYGGRAVPTARGDTIVSAETTFVNVTLLPNGTLRLFFGPFFTKHFFLIVNDYASVILGIGEGRPSLIAFRDEDPDDDDNFVVLTGVNGLADDVVTGVIIPGGTAQSM